MAWAAMKPRLKSCALRILDTLTLYRLSAKRRAVRKIEKLNDALLWIQKKRKKLPKNETAIVESQLEATKKALDEKDSLSLQEIESAHEAISGQFERVKHQRRSVVYEILGILFWVALITFVVRGFFFDSYSVRTDSMMPHIYIGDTLVANKSEFATFFPFSRIELMRHRLPRRSEVVVFLDPKNAQETYVKRVIGLPGDRIKLKGQQIFVNGKALKREYLGDYEYTDSEERIWSAALYRETDSNGFSYEVLYDKKDTARYSVKCFYCGKEFNIGKDKIFLLGDNRDSSADSRHWGSVPIGYVLGKPLFVLFSMDHRRIRLGRVGQTFN
jgi:signal peptidase I